MGRRGAVSRGGLKRGEEEEGEARELRGQFCGRQ